jgi:hypothetical protein
LYKRNGFINIDKIGSMPPQIIKTIELRILISILKIYFKIRVNKITIKGTKIDLDSITLIKRVGEFEHKPKAYCNNQ